MITNNIKTNYYKPVYVAKKIKEDNYITFVKTNKKILPLTCNVEMMCTQMPSLTVNNIFYDKDYAESLEQYLFEKYLSLKENTNNQTNELIKTFYFPTGKKCYGFLVDMENTYIEKMQLNHFFYYYVPKIHAAFTFIKNDLLDYCDYFSAFGNIYVTKFDEQKYYTDYQTAFTITELNQLINEFYKENEPEYE